MIVYNHYTNQRDYTWYDSSNIIYSECIDTKGEKKNLKIIFKEGRQYLYKDVDVNDYLMFKNAQSNGKAFNDHIRKYKAIRLADADIHELEDKKKSMMETEDTVTKATSNLSYKISINNDTREFRLSFNGNVIYEGIEDNVNIMRLFKCMSITYELDELTEPLNLSPEE